MLVIRSEGVDSKPIRIYPGRRQLYARAGLYVTCEQAEDDILARLERIEQLDDAIEWTHVELPTLRAFAQSFEIDPDQLLHPRIDVLIGVSFQAHNVSHDLLVGFSVVPVRRIAGRAEDRSQRPPHRCASESVGIEKRAVDVEQNEPHDLVRKTPAMMVTAPTPWKIVGISPRNAHAATNATIGCRFE